MPLQDNPTALTFDLFETALGGLTSSSEDSPVGEPLIEDRTDSTDFGIIGTLSLDYSGSVPGVVNEFTSVSLRLDNDSSNIGPEFINFLDANDLPSSVTVQFSGYERYVVTTTQGDDLVRTEAEGDVIHTLGGNDTIYAGFGADTIDAGAGDDFIDVGAFDPDADVVDAGAGDDIIVSVRETDTVHGGAGIDEVDINLQSTSLGATINLLTGDASGIVTFSGVERLSGRLGAGDDTVIAAGQVLSLDGSGISSSTDSLTVDYSGAGIGTANSFTSVSLLFDTDTFGSGDEVLNYLDLNDQAQTANIQLDDFEVFDVTTTNGDDVVRTRNEGDTITTLGGNDTIYAGFGADTIDAGAGDDFIDVGAFDPDADVVDAGAGDDIIVSVRETDTVHGGAGIDEVDINLQSTSLGATINLLTGDASGIVTFSGVERLSGRLGAGDDTVIAAGQVLSLDGSGISSSTDSLTVDYSGAGIGTANSFTSVSLLFDTDTFGSGDEVLNYLDLNDQAQTANIQLDDFEVFDVTTTNGDDVVRTRNEGDTITTLGGNDTIYAGFGADTIDAGAGEDAIDVGPDSDADIVDAGAGDDTITNVRFGDAVDGGAGIDFVEMSLSSGGGAVDINLLTGLGSGAVTFSNVERVTGVFGTGDDTFVAAGQLLDINGASGTDSLALDYSGAEPGTANAFTSVSLLFNSNTGDINYLDLADAAQSATISLRNFEVYDVTTTSGDDIVVTETGDDTITTLGGNDTIDAAQGADSIDAGAGDDFIDAGGDTDADVVDAGSGDDEIIGVARDDTVDGGAGIDLVEMSLSSGGGAVDINLLTGLGSGAVTFSGVERLTGSFGLGDDTLVAAGQVLDINGSSGTDTLTLDYSAGEAGVANSFTSVSLLLNSNTLETFNYLDPSDQAQSSTASIRNFEIFDITTTQGNDTVITLSQDDRIVTLGGNDTVDAGSGNDFVEGGAGADVLNGGFGTDTLSYESSDAGVQIDLDAATAAGGHAAGDTISGFENVIGSGFADMLTGDDGDNLLVGGAGDDSFDGGAGIDTVSYADAGGRVAVFLNRADDVGSGEGIDTFVSIENVIGSDFDDRINGDAADNILTGGLGDDVLVGLAGNDTLDGGAGDDELTGSGGDDTLIGGDGNDQLFGLGGADFFDGGDGDDLIEGGLGVDTIYGGAGNDDIFGLFGFENIFGGDGDDNIRADGSGDTVDGGAGNDRIVGGNGKDILFGGAGNDVLFGGFAFTNGDTLRDVFVFKSAANGGGGFDIIRDFEDTTDKLDFSETDYTNFADVFADASQVGANVEINIDGGGIVRINNFDLADLTAGDFLF